MPKIKQFNVIDVSVEKFLDACTGTELHEVEILLQRPKYRELIDGNPRRKKQVNDWYLNETTLNNQQQ